VTFTQTVVALGAVERPLSVTCSAPLPKTPEPPWPSPTGARAPA